MMFPLSTEHKRYNLVLERDGAEEATAFATRTKEVYKNVILQKRYGFANRKSYIESYLFYRKLLGEK